MLLRDREGNLENYIVVYIDDSGVNLALNAHSRGVLATTWTGLKQMQDNV